MRSVVQAIRDYLTVPIHRQLDLAHDEAQEEIKFHLASRIEDYHRQGLSLEESKTAALEQFGDVDRVVQECCRENSGRQVLMHRSHLSLTAILLLTTSVLFWHVFHAENSKTSSQQAASPDAALASLNYNGDVGGLVVDGLGKPLARANVMVAVKWWPENGFRQQCYMRTTNECGKFSIEDVYPADARHEVQIAAIADGHLLTSQYIDDQDHPLNSLSIELPSASAELAVEFRSSNGQPISGVAAFPHQRFEATGVGHTVYFQSADRIIRRSDDSGCMKFTNFSPGDRAIVFVRFPNHDWQPREIVVPDDESTVVVTQSLPDTIGG